MHVNFSCVCMYVFIYGCITFIAATFSQNQTSPLAVPSPGRQTTAHNTIAPAQVEVAVKVNGTVYDIDLKESFVDIKAESGHCNRGGRLFFCLEIEGFH